MLYWVYKVSPVIAGVAICLIFLVFSWVSIFVARARIHRLVHKDPNSNTMVALGLESLSVFLALLLGLLAVAAYQNYSNVGDLVDKEGSSIAALYRDFSGYPQPIRDRLQADLREYTRFTIEEGWRQQQRGETPTGGNERMDKVFASLLTFEPSKRSEEIIHVETIRQFDHLVEARRMRLANVTAGLPHVLWWAVVLGAALEILLLALLDMQLGLHLAVGGAVAVFVGALVFVIAELDNPFRGDVSVRPHAIQLVYDTVMRKPTQ